eukprot:scaffold53409_cov18-Tisochrysis_lutea.AAC.1
MQLQSGPTGRNALALEQALTHAVMAGCNSQIKSKIEFHSYLSLPLVHTRPPSKSFNSYMAEG